MVIDEPTATKDLIDNFNLLSCRIDSVLISAFHEFTTNRKNTYYIIEITRTFVRVITKNNKDTLVCIPINKLRGFTSPEIS